MCWFYLAFVIILLVEDEVELAHLVRDYLEAAGFEVSMFHDGQD
ncbi:hypothetical protein ACFMKF_20180, partial [Acinetobacter baumannii]